MHRDQAPGAAPPGERPDSRRRPPRTDAVLADPRLAEAARRLGRPLVKPAVVDAQERARRGQIAPADVADEALLALPPTACALCPVLNAIGVLLHTNLGRAALSEAARQAVLAAAGATDVEFDLASGDRAPRGRSTVRALLDRVPAAQAAHVVNNGAAALVLAATALAQGARSSSAGASWSRSATASACPTCSPRRARGCARSARPTGRRGLAAGRGGPGHRQWRFKLLGGPQCGLLLGRAELVRTLARHPLARALRVDKLTLAALEATLNSPATPTRSALHAELRELRERAGRLAATLAAEGVPARVVDSPAVVGGGGAPGMVLPSAAVALPEAFAAPLRQGPTPVVGRTADGSCLLDLRTVPAPADAELAAAVRLAAEWLARP